MEKGQERMREVISMNIDELLKLRELGFEKFNVKLFRHPAQVLKVYKVDGRNHILELDKLYRKDLKYIETYQSYQRKGFECGNYVICFIGTEGVEAKFIGVYQVKDRKRVMEVPVSSNLTAFLHESGLKLEENFINDSCVFFELERDKKFDDLKDRLVINWGKATLSWHQWLFKNGRIINNKEVVEILPKGKVIEFPGDYGKVNITFNKLSDIINNLGAHKDWKVSLAAVAGVYLIVDDETGKQYIGSAYGIEGILGRWKYYVETGGHGENKKLKELFSDKGKDYTKNFRFSILHILSKTLAREEVIKWEGIYKEKLGTRATGLNIN